MALDFFVTLNARTYGNNVNSVLAKVCEQKRKLLGKCNQPEMDEGEVRLVNRSEELDPIISTPNTSLVFSCFESKPPRQTGFFTWCRHDCGQL